MSIHSKDGLSKALLALGLALFLGILAPVGCGSDGLEEGKTDRDATKQRVAEDEKDLARGKAAGKSPYQGKSIKGRVMQNEPTQ